MNAPGPRGQRSAYDQRFVPLLFDVLIACMFAPFGGVGRAAACSGRTAGLAAWCARARVLDHAVPQYRSTTVPQYHSRAVPQSRLFGRAWRALLLRLEPMSVRSVIEQGYAVELSATGFEVVEERSLAGGTTRPWIARGR